MIKAILAMVMCLSALVAQPTQSVSCYQRTIFGHLKGRATNPFMDLKVAVELSGLSGVGYYFVNPDTGFRSTLAQVTLPVTGTLVTFPAPPQDALGEFGEYVLFVNCPN